MESVVEGAPTVVVGVLGPTAVRAPGGAALARSPRLSALLAWLVLLGRDAAPMVEQARRDLYEHLAPERGRREVRRQLARLDDLLDPTGTATVREGALHLALEGAVDVDRFQAMVHDAFDLHRSIDDRLARGAAGLALWRGPRAYPDLEGLPVAVAEADRLDLAREALVDLHAGLRLIVGPDVALVPELAARAGQAPPRPIVARQLAVALARSGRPADGLVVLGDAVRLLGPAAADDAWRTVEAALLDGAVPEDLPALVLPAPPSHRAPSSSG